LFANFPVAVSLHAQHYRDDPGLTVTILLIKASAMVTVYRGHCQTLLHARD